jgi:hypothetical protein
LVSGFGESISKLGSISIRSHLGLFLAAFFHSGALDFRSTGRSSENRMYIDSVIHLASIVISSSILFRIPSPTFAPLLGLIIKIIISLIAVYSGLSCIFPADDKNRLQNLILAFFSTICLAFFIGNIDAGVNWLVFFILIMGISKLFNLKSNFILVVFFLYYILYSGFPYTYLSYGSRGMLANGFSLFSFLTILPHAMILADYFQNTISMNEVLIETDPWKQAFYFLGTIPPVLTLAAIRLKNPLNAETGFEYWWAGLSVVLISLFVSFYSIRSISKGHLNNQKKIEPDSEMTGAWNWITNIGQFFYTIAGQLVVAISNLLEGRGGMLWAIVLLALLLTVLRL